MFLCWFQKSTNLKRISCWFLSGVQWPLCKGFTRVATCNSLQVVTDLTATRPLFQPLNIHSCNFVYAPINSKLHPSCRGINVFYLLKWRSFKGAVGSGKRVFKRVTVAYCAFSKKVNEHKSSTWMGHLSSILALGVWGRGGGRGEF